MIVIVPASELQVGDVFSTDGYRVTTLVPLTNGEIWVDTEKDGEIVSKRELLTPGFPCPLYLDLDALEQKWRKRLVATAAGLITPEHDTFEDALFDGIIEAVEAVMFEASDWYRVPATAISDVANDAVVLAWKHHVEEVIGR